MVVFLNNDGTEGADGADDEQKYELPNTAPNLQSGLSQQI